MRVLTAPRGARQYAMGLASPLAPACAPPPSLWLMMESMSMRRDSSVCTAPHASNAAMQFMRPFFEAIISAEKPCAAHQIVTNVKNT
eukprot:9497927-Pyramimonas_sp.AAC.1